MKHLFALLLVLATVGGARSLVTPEPQAPLAPILLAPVAPIVATGLAMEPATEESVLPPAIKSRSIRSV